MHGHVRRAAFTYEQRRRHTRIPRSPANCTKSLSNFDSASVSSDSISPETIPTVYMVCPWARGSAPSLVSVSWLLHMESVTPSTHSFNTVSHYVPSLCRVGTSVSFELLIFPRRECGDNKMACAFAFPIDAASDSPLNRRHSTPTPKVKLAECSTSGSRHCSAPDMNEYRK